jgi:hypothetical protein
MTSIDNTFINRIRAVANIWHNTLDDEARDKWFNANLTKDGGRPDMKTNYGNGWNLFAMLALAPLAMHAVDFQYENPDSTTTPDSITFDHADSDAQEFHFTIGFGNPPMSDAHIFAFIHQVDPKHIDKRDASRRTFCVGFYQCLEAPAGDQSFSTPCVYPFNLGDKVQVLLRLHKSLDGVENYMLTCTAT